MSLLPISCYIRTHNEAKRIGAVIKAAREVVEEVIVIDSGSNDATREIALQAGARVLQHDWQGDGHQKRQERVLVKWNQFCFQSASRSRTLGDAARSGATGKSHGVLGGRRWETPTGPG